MDKQKLRQMISDHTVVDGMRYDRSGRPTVISFESEVRANYPVYGVTAAGQLGFPCGLRGGIVTARYFFNPRLANEYAFVVAGTENHPLRLGEEIGDDPHHGYSFDAMIDSLWGKLQHAKEPKQEN